jgi:hypothetical protein
MVACLFIGLWNYQRKPQYQLQQVRFGTFSGLPDRFSADNIYRLLVMSAFG